MKDKTMYLLCGLSFPVVAGTSAALSIYTALTGEPEIAAVSGGLAIASLGFLYSINNFQIYRIGEK